MECFYVGLPKWTVQLLLKEHVDPNVQNNYGQHFFMIACHKLINPNFVQRNYGWNAFMWACQNRHNQIVKLLLKKQINIMFKVIMISCTALMFTRTI